MQTLTLIIKQRYFDEIIAGTKTEETRELRPKSERKYVVIDEEGAIVDIIKYDAIRFFVGYNKDRDSALVKVNNALIEVIEDESGKAVTFFENGQEHIMCNVVYGLGNVLERNRQ